MMDWNTCIREKNVKQVTPDTELAKSLLKTSANKTFSSKSLELRQETSASKISLSYDSIREFLEAMVLLKGFLHFIPERNNKLAGYGRYFR